VLLVFLKLPRIEIVLHSNRIIYVIISSATTLPSIIPKKSPNSYRRIAAADADNAASPLSALSFLSSSSAQHTDTSLTSDLTNKTPLSGQTYSAGSNISDLSFNSIDLSSAKISSAEENEVMAQVKRLDEEDKKIVNIIEEMVETDTTNPPTSCKSNETRSSDDVKPTDIMVTPCTTVSDLNTETWSILKDMIVRNTREKEQRKEDERRVTMTSNVVMSTTENQHILAPTLNESDAVIQPEVSPQLNSLQGFLKTFNQSQNTLTDTNTTNDSEVLLREHFTQLNDDIHQNNNIKNDSRELHQGNFTYLTDNNQQNNTNLLTDEFLNIDVVRNFTNSSRLREFDPGMVNTGPNLMQTGQTGNVLQGLENSTQSNIDQNQQFETNENKPLFSQQGQRDMLSQTQSVLNVIQKRQEEPAGNLPASLSINTDLWPMQDNPSSLSSLIREISPDEELATQDFLKQNFDVVSRFPANSLDTELTNETKFQNDNYNETPKFPYSINTEISKFPTGNITDDVEPWMTILVDTPKEPKSGAGGYGVPPLADL